MVGSDLRADLPDQHAGGDHRPHEMVQDRGCDAAREGQLHRLIDKYRSWLAPVVGVFVRWRGRTMLEQKASFLTVYFQGIYVSETERCTLKKKENGSCNGN
uniref:Uncharacterized protein n=1 Tax=Aegilops tauschii subsp. strangulata TaxID=200361 RepID=A0A453PTR7_AEGTS